MKLDYVLRFHNKYKEYNSMLVLIQGVPRRSSLPIGEKKLTKEGREIYSDVLQFEVELDKEDEVVVFKTDSIEKGSRFLSFLHAFNGNGSLVKQEELFENVKSME